MRTTCSKALVWLGLVVPALGGAACSHSPVAPGPTTPDLTGTWAGSASDTSGFGDFVWRLQQGSGGAVSGVVEITDRGVSITGRGTISGTVTPSGMQFTLVVPAGGFDAPYDNCSSTVTGDATLATGSLTATYSGTSTCGGKIYSGQVTLRRL